jgi:hypothetical protein
MTVAWHYSRDGKKHGPVSSPELQSLARKGLLNPEDLVWKEGMESWQKAGQLKGLFPTVAAAPPLMPVKEASGTATNLKQGVTALGASAKVSGELALKQAEKTKIQTLSLPQAYAALGKAVYEQGTQHPDTAALFVAISDLCQQLAAVRSADTALSEKATLSERAINLGKQAKAAIDIKSLESNLHRHYVQLGKRTYQQADLPNHEHVKAQGIHKLLERDKELSQQISALGEQMGAHGEQMQQMAKATAKKGYSLLLTAATVVTFAVAPLSWLPIWKHPSWGTSRKITLAMMSLACTIALLTYGQIMTAAATKAVTSANAEWDNGNQDEAITQYRSLLPNSTFLGKEEQARVYRRLIEFDAGHANADGARRLIGEADEKNLDLSLTEPRATELLAEYQQQKREREERRKQDEAEKAAKESPSNSAAFSQSQLNAIKTNKILSAVYALGELTPEEYENSVGTLKGTKTDYSLMLALVPSSKWFTLAKKVGLSRSEFQSATHFLFSTLFANKGYDPSTLQNHAYMLKEATGKTLSDY